MKAPDRYRLVAPLPPAGTWRRSLATEWTEGGPRAVVLHFSPEGLDRSRIEALERRAGAAACVLNPHVAPALRFEQVEEGAVLVEPHRSGVTLRALLNQGGRLPGDVAARIVADVCAGLGAARTIEVTPGRPLAHGSLAAEWVQVCTDGTAVVTGFAAGRGGEADAAPSDLRAVGGMLWEAVAGEPPPAAVPLEAPGVPSAIGEVAGQALAGGFEAPEALATALGQALEPAGHDTVAAYLEATLPAADGRRGTVAAQLEDALRAAPSGARQQPGEGGAPEATGGPGTPPRGPVVTAVVLLGMLGFFAGFGLARRSAGTQPPAASAQVVPVAATARATHPADPAPAQQPPAPARKRTAAVKRTSAPRGAPKEAPRAPASGTLAVQAPPGADVFVDGRRVGAGRVRVQLAPGAHRVEVRLGSARTGESFELASGEVWTYAVAPTD